MVFYTNQWESLFFAPLFIYGGMITFFLMTGYDGWLMTYINISGVIGILFLIITGFRLKDNGSLGLAIFFTIAFITVFVNGTETPYLALIINFSYPTFGLFFAMGKFTPFKEAVINE